MKPSTEESDTPLVKGGQGRTAASLESDAGGTAVVLTVAAIALLVVLSCL
tara:strand:+ start:9380 stop:9529 length:150 start_codon:yes stop_codon:yes gene_type:complete